MRLEEELFNCAENHNAEKMKSLLERGANPNKSFNDGWDCDVLTAVFQTYTRSDSIHDCVNALIDHGAKYIDSPVMDLHKNDLKSFESRIKENPDILGGRYHLDYGDRLTLRGVTLLHIAAEYNYKNAVDLLVSYGADVNARADIGNNGVGGQTPIYHLIGSIRGCKFELFEHFLALDVDLDVKATIQAEVSCADALNKRKDYSYSDIEVPDWQPKVDMSERIQELSPVEYAKKHAAFEFTTTGEEEIRMLKVKSKA